MGFRRKFCRAAGNKVKPIWMEIQRIVYEPHITDAQFRDIMAQVACCHGLAERETRLEGLQRLSMDAIMETERRLFVH